MMLKTEAINNSLSPSANYLAIRNINAEEFNPSAFGMFDFSPVGILIAGIGVLFIALIGWRLIPKESYKKPEEGSLFSIDEYITEIRIPENCKLIGLKVGDIEKFTDDRLSIFGSIDDNGKIQSIRRNKIIQENDRFLIKSDPIE